MVSITEEGSIFLVGVLIIFCVKEIVAQTKKWSWIPEASLLMFGGIVCSLIISFLFSRKNELLEFNSSLFYYILLPPIIFNSGLDIDFSCFKSNLFAIMLYANIGTLINCFVVCFLLYFLGIVNASTPITIAEGMSFGSLVSATDPVTTLVVFEKFQVEKNLFGIILGVSILDDAVAVLIFELFNGLIGTGNVTVVGCVMLLGEFVGKFFGSLLLGYVSGIGYSLLTRLCIYGRNNNERSAQMVCFLLLFSYFVFYFAEMCDLSGIISALYLAIYWKHQEEVLSRTSTSDRELHDASYQQTKASISAIATIFESITFYLIGLSVLSYPLGTSSDWTFFGWSFVACLVGRALQIYPLAFLINLFGIDGLERGEHEHEHRRVRSSSSVDDHESHLDDNMESIHHMLPSTSHTNQMIPPPLHLFTLKSLKDLLVFNPKKTVKLPLGYQHMMFLAGLRGPIAYSTSQLFNNSLSHTNLVKGTTSLTVLFTTFVFGALTGPALRWFKIPFSEEWGANENENGSNLWCCCGFYPRSNLSLPRDDHHRTTEEHQDEEEKGIELKSGPKQENRKPSQDVQTSHHITQQFYNILHVNEEKK